MSGSFDNGHVFSDPDQAQVYGGLIALLDTLEAQQRLIRLLVAGQERANAMLEKLTGGLPEC